MLNNLETFQFYLEIRKNFLILILILKIKLLEFLKFAVKFFSIWNYWNSI